MARVRGNSSADLSDIQREMALVRHEMHEDVRGAVRGAQSLTDWRSIVANHPWASLSIAAAAGYLLVPGRRSDGIPSEARWAAALAEARRAGTAARAVAVPATRWSLFRSALDVLSPVAVRAAQNYALHKLNQFLAPPTDGRTDHDRAQPGEAGEGRPDDRDLMAGTVRFRDRS
jgi:hypothetical protein